MGEPIGSIRQKILRAVVIFVLPALAAHAVQVASWAEQATGQGLSNAERLIEASDCTSCHTVDRRVVGPSYLDVANTYAGQASASEILGRSIREGGSGTWGDVAMTPHPDLNDADLTEIVAWILSLENEVPARPRKASTTEYTYTLGDGSSVTLDFPLFIEDQAPTVTRDVFRGYLLYNSYCFRCHGQDATQSQLAPDLRASLTQGMTAQQFLSVAMVGDEDQGMPGWAGFLSEEEVRQIHMYVEGRRLGLVPVGRPPSDY